MSERKPFLLRINPEVWEEIQRLAAAELRSVNSEIEVLLREALARRRRRKGYPAGGRSADAVTDATGAATGTSPDDTERASSDSGAGG